MASGNRTSESGIDWDLEYHLSTFGVTLDEDDMSEFYDPDNFGYLQNDFSQMSLDPENTTEETFHEAQMSLNRARQNASIPTTTTTTTTTNNNNTMQQPSQVISGKTSPVNYRGTVVDLRSGRSSNDRSTMADRYEQQNNQYASWQDHLQYFDTHRPSNQEISSPSLGSTNQPSSSLLGLSNEPVSTASSNIRAPSTSSSSRPVAPIRKIPMAKGPLTITKEHLTIQDKRKRAVELLPPEPNENDENVICIAILLPSGQRVKRRFLKTDSLSILKAFIWSHEKVPDKFQVSTNFPRKILYCTLSSSHPIVQTFEEAGINSNELLYVTPVVPPTTT